MGVVEVPGITALHFKHLACSRAIEDWRGGRGVPLNSVLARGPMLRGQAPLRGLGSRRVATAHRHVQPSLSIVLCRRPELLATHVGAWSMALHEQLRQLRAKDVCVTLPPGADLLVTSLGLILGE